LNYKSENVYCSTANIVGQYDKMQYKHTTVKNILDQKDFFFHMHTKLAFI